MGNLAATYFNIGRHADALAMQERVLEFSRRLLPEDHPSIGEGHVWSGVARGVRSLIRVVRQCSLQHELQSRENRRTASRYGVRARGAAHMAGIASARARGHH